MHTSIRLPDLNTPAASGRHMDVTLLDGLNAGDKIQFTVDAATSGLTAIRVVESAR